MGKLTISMAIFNSHVKLPEGDLSQFYRERRFAMGVWGFNVETNPQ